MEKLSDFFSLGNQKKENKDFKDFKDNKECEQLLQKNVAIVIINNKHPKRKGASPQSVQPTCTTKFTTRLKEKK